MADCLLIDPALLRQLLDYDPATGLFVWREREASFFSGKRAVQRRANWNARYAGGPALTTQTSDGYLRGKIMQLPVLAHRAAFAIIHGEWPEQVDHINGVRSDNRISNLRAANNAVNSRNQRRLDRNTSGVTGVVQVGRKWLASIMVNQKRYHLGHFDTIEDAAAARKAAEVRYEFHENHGR